MYDYVSVKSEFGEEIYIEIRVKRKSIGKIRFLALCAGPHIFFMIASWML